MALFGTFADVAFPDVIFLIGSGAGTLTIRQQNYELLETYELSMEDAHITRMCFNGQEIHSSEQARSFITEVIRNGNGEFEFHRGPVIKGSLFLNTTEALLSSISMLDEMAGLKEQFPDPYTIFLENDKVSRALDPDLQNFWSPNEPYFREGICAAELSEKVGLFLDQILLKFYKLRLSEMIVPRRAYHNKTEPLPTLELKRIESELDAEMQALAKQLQPIWTSPKTVPLPAPISIVPDDRDKTQLLPPPDFSSVQIYRPDKHMAGKFMVSLKKLMKVS